MGRYRPREPGCPFCDLDLVVGVEETGKCWTDEHGQHGVVRFPPLDPVTEGHVLFVPTQHVLSAADGPWIAARVFEAAACYVRDQEIQANIITSSGPLATQTVFHLHVHVVPRRHGDGLHLPWTGQGG